MVQIINMVQIPVGYRFHKAAIDEAATKHGLDSLLVAALVWQESGFNADAFRHEPAFWNRYMKKNVLYAHLNPRRVSSSYGLMQVMYCRLLEDKTTENDTWDPEFLFVPKFNLDIGCGLLAELHTWATARTTDAEKVVIAALAAYNGGRGGNDPSKNWPVRNGKYAREVVEKRTWLVSANIG